MSSNNKYNYIVLDGETLIGDGSKSQSDRESDLLMEMCRLKREFSADRYVVCFDYPSDPLDFFFRKELISVCSVERWVPLVRESLLSYDLMAWLRNEYCREDDTIAFVSADARSFGLVSERADFLLFDSGHLQTWTAQDLRTKFEIDPSLVWGLLALHGTQTSPSKLAREPGSLKRMLTEAGPVNSISEIETWVQGLPVGGSLRQDIKERLNGMLPHPAAGMELQRFIIEEPLFDE